MKTKKVFFLPCLMALLAVSGTRVLAEDSTTAPNESTKRGSMMSPNTTEDSLLTKAVDAYRRVVRSSQGEVPKNVLAKANCVAIVPNAVTAAAGIGGMRGEGVGFCKSQTAWKGPVFLDLTAASIGAQAGVKSASMVFFLTGDNAEHAMLENGYKFGGELSAVAGKYDEQVAIPRSGIIAYSDTKGLFAGASLSEGSLSRDDKKNREYYGSSADSKDILSLDSAQTDSNALKELKDLLPKS